MIMVITMVITYIDMNFINTLEGNKDVRKIFGKREIVIIKKQLLGVHLKPSEKTRLSRDIRKKLGAIKELAKFSNEFDLKYGQIVKEQIENAKEIILESSYFPRIKKILLFGSAAENKRTLFSDIDIAVEFDKIDLSESTQFRIKTYVNDDIDIQVYNVLPDKIKKEIDEKGKVLYERQNK